MHTTTPIKPLVSAPIRAATAIGVIAIVALAWVGTAEASHEAVDSCAQAFTPATAQVVVRLKPVEIVGRRSAA